MVDGLERLSSLVRVVSLVGYWLGIEGDPATNSSMASNLFGWGPGGEDGFSMNFCFARSCKSWQFEVQFLLILASKDDSISGLSLA